LPVDWHFLNSKEKRDRMRHLALALVLACVLSGAARAGEIPTTGAVPPPPSSSVVTIGEIRPTGEIHPTGETAPDESSTILTMILTLIGIVR
jgi:hypothetical protein